MMKDAERLAEDIESLGDRAVDDFHDILTDIESQEGVYLSGPIRCVDDNGVTWRNELMDDFPDLVYHNPLDSYNPEEEIILNDPINFDESESRRQVLPTEYVADDKIHIEMSECIFVGLPDNVARGTMMECMYGYMRDTPVFVWKIDAQEESGWIYEHAEFMSDDREEVMEEVMGYVE